MMTPPKLGGAAQLRLFVEELGFRRCCKLLDVHETTMRRWLREESEPPRAALLALFWQSNWGFCEAMGYASQLHNILVNKINRLETGRHFHPPARWAAANEPEFAADGLVVPIGMKIAPGDLRPRHAPPAAAELAALDYEQIRANQWWAVLRARTPLGDPDDWFGSADDRA